MRLGYDKGKTRTRAGGHLVVRPEGEGGADMPRAFLITRRRYNGTGEFEETGREYSPERGVRLAEYGGGQQPTSDGASECGSEESSSECPEELYNLTKLAEVSLAAAAGTLVHPAGFYHHHHQLHQLQHQQQHQRPLQPLHQRHHEAERTRIFFERIESERESLVELKSRRMDETVGQGDALLVAARLGASARYTAEFESDDVILSETTTTTTTTPTTTTINLSSPGGKCSPATIQQLQSQSQPQQPIDPLDQDQQQQALQHSQQQQQDGLEEHECPDCGKKYSTSSNLARHRQTHRSLGDKKARRCPHCDKVYVSIPAFSMHVRTHNQGCKCHYCGKCFSRPWLLQGHIRTHTGEKPFKCTICNKAFADKSNLRAHIQTHSNTKPHVCTRCGKAFALKSYLYKHEESSCMRAHHHHQRVTDKRETSASPVSSSQPLTTRLSSSNSATVAISQPTASPTSVIVPPRNFQGVQEAAREQQQPRSNSAFSAIIRHTRTTPDRLEDEDYAATPAKRQLRCVDETIPAGETESQPQGKDLLSRMVIRTSVISPNPEHLLAARFGEQKKMAQQQQQQQMPQPPQQTHRQPFDFNDPTRVSAFSRPQPMTLNLAIA